MYKTEVRSSEDLRWEAVKFKKFLEKATERGKNLQIIVEHRNFTITCLDGLIKLIGQLKVILLPDFVLGKKVSVSVSFKDK